jgi:hypothetical protein
MTDLANFDPDAMNSDLLQLIALKSLIDNCQIVLEDIDLFSDPTLITAPYDDLDWMPEILGDLKSNLGAIVSLTSRMYLIDRPQEKSLTKPLLSTKQTPNLELDRRYGNVAEEFEDALLEVDVADVEDGTNAIEMALAEGVRKYCRLNVLDLQVAIKYLQQD